MDPIEMFERAASAAAALGRSVRSDQLGQATPCSEWDVATLLEHMAGGPAYVWAALGMEGVASGRWPDEDAIAERAALFFEQVICFPVRQPSP